MRISSYLNNREREREEEGWRKNNLKMNFYFPFWCGVKFLRQCLHDPDDLNPAGKAFREHSRNIQHNTPLLYLN